MKELIIRLENIGFFNTSYGYYFAKTSLLITLLLCTHVLIFQDLGLGKMVLLSGFWGILGAQFGMIAHDAGHNITAGKVWVNKIYGYLCMPFINGNSFNDWKDHHNKHHKNVQVEGIDPDMEFDMMFSIYERQARQRKGRIQSLQKIQYIYYWIGSFFFAWSFRLVSIRYLIGNCKYYIGEVGVIVFHYLVWIGFPGLYIGFIQSLINYFIYSAVLSFYITMIFTINHVGLPTLPANHNVSYERLQIEHSRNIKNQPIFDFIFGGLNFHIEHHLFPNAAVNRLRSGNKIIAEYSKEKKINYNESGLFESLGKVYRHFKKIETILREEGK